MGNEKNIRQGTTTNLSKQENIFHLLKETFKAFLHFVNPCIS